MIDTTITALFVLVMIANVIALVRHWQMMRVMNIMLGSLVDTQRQYFELMEQARHD